jgi:hypothetical protein
MEPEEPSLANVLAQEPTFWGRYIRPMGSAQPHEPWQWAKNNPEIANSLSRLIGYLALSARSGRGAASANRAIAATREAQVPDPAIMARMRLPVGEELTTWAASQPLPYPRYEYQVFGDKGRWMNDALPSLRNEGASAADRGLRQAGNDLATAAGRPSPWETTDPFVDSRNALSDAGREMLGMPAPEIGYGASPGLPQYPRIPSHWVPENNPAKFTLRGPRGIADQATFTGDSLADILAQIARTELKPSHRAYLEALARQRFGKNE